MVVNLKRLLTFSFSFILPYAKNALVTQNSVTAIVHKTTSTKRSKAPNPLVTDGCLKPGTDLRDWRETECQTSVFLPIAVVPMLLDGCVEYIRKSQKEWCRERCVSVGVASVAAGAVQSQSEIAAIFTCTSSKELQSANYVTAALAMVRYWFSPFSQLTGLKQTVL